MISIENKLQELGFILKKSIQYNKFVNCAHVTKPNKRDSVWYRYDQDKPFVSYGSWNGCLDDGYFFVEESKPFTEEEKKAYAKKKAEYEAQFRKQAEEDRERRIQNVRLAYNQTRQYKQSHPYLTKKRINFRSDFTFDWQDRLVIPMRNCQGDLTGYQYIDSEGNKKFKTGSITKESFYVFKPESVKLENINLFFIAEGVATAGSIYQALMDKLDAISYCVLATFSAGNVKPVINALSNIVQKKNIIGLADNDEAGVNAYLGSGVDSYVCGLEPGHDANDIANQFGLDALGDLIIEYMKNS